MVMDELKADLEIKYCTLTLSVMLNPAVKCDNHSINRLASGMLGGFQFLNLSDIFINPKKTDTDLLGRDIMRLYACPTADNCRRYFESKHKELRFEYQFDYDCECKLADLKSEQRLYGIRTGNYTLYERTFFWIDQIPFDKHGNYHCGLNTLTNK
jgi:hypothetical protein